MSRDDDPDGPPTPRSLQINWQRKTAEAVTNLVLALDAKDKADKYRHEELVGLVLAVTDPAVARKMRPRDTPPEGTDKFRLPEGVRVELPRETTKKWLERVGKIAFYLALVALTHAARCLAEYQINASRAHREAPPPVAAPVE
jgi:hypothetical protein